MREHREIIFSHEEVVGAVTALMSANGMLPTGGIAALRIVDSEGSVAAVVSLASTKAGRPQELQLSAEHLGAALIAACRSSRVPLPRAAKKRLARAEDGVVLNIDVPER
jgi:hypothetical protein